MERGADPMTGRVLDGRYRVGAKIARGGMATVYEALDLRLDRGCAVKVMHSDLGDDADFRRRFVREAHAAARLSHPNVVSVSDQGDDDGALFLVMEHVEGRTLREVMREEAPMPPERALALLEPVLAALSEAHAAGLVHRDVKPENVLHRRRRPHQGRRLRPRPRVRRQTSARPRPAASSSGRSPTSPPSSSSTAAPTRASTCTPPGCCSSRC